MDESKRYSDGWDEGHDVGYSEGWSDGYADAIGRVRDVSNQLFANDAAARRQVEWLLTRVQHNA